MENLQDLLAQLTYELAHNQECDSLQTAIIECLGNHPAEAADFLLKHIPLISEPARATFVWAMGFVASEVHLLFLYQLLTQDQTPAVRSAAAEALANFPNHYPTRLALINALQHDPDQHVRLTAQSILAHFYHLA